MTNRSRTRRGNGEDARVATPRPPQVSPFTSRARNRSRYREGAPGGHEISVGVRGREFQPT
jgi:hypothetical protein